MTDQVDRRAESTRLQILRAASHQFAYRSYSSVSLDDILADADVTKGAMYFHFRSKHALAVAIIEHRAEVERRVVVGLLGRQLSGLETMIEVLHAVAVHDMSEETARAGFNLLESIGRTDGLQARFLGDWIGAFADISRRAISEGDLLEGCDPRSVARTLVSVYLGIRHTSCLDHAETFLTDLEKAWLLTLPGFAAPDRLGYFGQFIRRRTARAVGTTVPLPCGVL